jgi:AraC-like DNA-binding protein
MLLFPNVPDTIPAIGLLGMGAIGPLLFYYVKGVLGEKIKTDRRFLAHFLFCGGIGIGLLFSTDLVIFWLYLIAVIQMGAYITGTIRKIVKTDIGSDTGRWLKYLVISIGIMWLVFTVQLFTQDWVQYLAGTMVASLVLFGLLFYCLRHNWIFRQKRKNNRSPINYLLSRRLIQLMERDKLYKQNDLSLVKLGAILNVKPYVISNVLNEYQGKTFPEFINAYRIKEAQKLLQSEKHSIYSIEAIAFDCGFNTPSAFYSYFKKITKLTPSQYRAGLK